MSSEDDYKLVWQKACDLLARREHSARELELKLLQRDYPEALVHDVIRDLQKRNYQSDERYARILVRSRLERGYGERYIKAELEHKQVDFQGLKPLLEEEKVDWWQLACDAYTRKFAHKAKNHKEKQKHMQFLARRGFDYDLIRKVVENAHEDTH